MALSPEDVIKKSFSATHLRRGYDETQVDDFLDEVVVELRRMLADQDDLAAQLEDCRGGMYDGDGHGGAAAFAGGGSLDEEQLAQVRREREELVAELEMLSGQLDSRRAEVDEVETDAARRVDAARLKASQAEAEANTELEGRLHGELLELQKKVEATRAEAAEAQERLAELKAEAGSAEQAVSQAQAAAGDAERRATEAEGRAREAEGRASEAEGRANASAAAPAAAAAVGGGAAVAAMSSQSEDPTKIIELAQRLHDQHVSEGQQTKQRLIGEGEAYRDKVVAEADKKASTLIREGQEKHDELVATGQAEHDKLVNAGQARFEELVSTGQAEHDKVIGEASSRRDAMVGDAETKRSAILTDLETKQSSLTGRIEELRTFEGDYRNKLRGYLSEQIDFLDRDGDGIDDRKQ